MAAVSFRLFAGASPRLVSANKTVYRAALYDALTRASSASRMRPQSPGGIPCIYIPYAATSSHTATRRHALESAPAPADSAARALYRDEDYAFPTPPATHPPRLLRTINVDAASWRDIPNSSSGIS